MLHEAIAAAELSTEGWEVEIVDLRSIKPLDTDTVMASVARTGKLLCVGEAWPWGGVTAEIISRVTSEGYGLTDAPQRLNTRECTRCHIIPTSGPRIIPPPAASLTRRGSFSANDQRNVYRQPLLNRAHGRRRSAPAAYS